MIYKELYLQGKNILTQNNIESPSFDAMEIMNLLFGLDRRKLVLYGEKEVSQTEINHFLKLIAKRKNGYPLQYILGKWEFLQREFFVGDGVLVPREDTATLVNFALNWAKNKNCKQLNVVDLCSGSGIIAITMACEQNFKNVYALELSQEALFYLNKNNNQYGSKVNVLNKDVLDNTSYESLGKVDIIVSNPPYIPNEDIKGLSKEVQNEPIMALAGGTDGLDFYRVLSKISFEKLNDGGLFAVECGINQAQEIEKMIISCGYQKTGIVKDYNLIDRVVWGEK